MKVSKMELLYAETLGKLICHIFGHKSVGYMCRCSRCLRLKMDRDKTLRYW